MPTPEQLLNRLESIADSLQASGHALALIGLGSVGSELERLDQHSDLDFFVIVEAGHKEPYIHNLDWLRIAPVAYAFQNTADGYKLLYADGIFCEFAVFEPGELKHIPFSAGRVVWKQPHIEASTLAPLPKPSSASAGVQWQIGEALTNLLIGLKRFQRGETLSASRFVQHYALDRVLELAQLTEAEQPYLADQFSRERRFEQGFPELAQRLPSMAQGYQRTPESALAILEFLEAHFEVNGAIAREIRALCAEGQPAEPFQSIPTKRLIIRRLQDDDLDVLVAYRSLPEVAWMQLWDSYDHQQGRKLIEACKAIEPFTPGDSFQFGVEHRESGTLIGDLYFKLNQTGQEAEIGYTFDPRFQGQGLATEAVRALVDYAFTKKGLHRIFGISDPRNTPSIRLMERLGMRQEAHFRKNLWFKGEWADDVVFAVLDEEWM